MKGKKMNGFPTREQALTDFFAEWEFEPKVELVSLADSCDRIVARDLVSANTLPVVRSSCCDGIAVRAADFAQGMPDTSAWRLGSEYVRADTGDDFPDEFDSVIMIEEVTMRDDGSIEIEPDVQVTLGCNVNAAGSSIREGDPVMAAGMPIRPTDLAAMAVGGIAMVPVFERPKVAFIPTGSELVPAGVKPRRGQNVDTNSLMVPAMLRQMGADPIVFPIVYDIRGALNRAIEEAIESADMVVINGGTALGSEDFNFQILRERGKLVHHYIAAAPGRPLAMAVIDGKPVVNLPGPSMGAWYGAGWCLSACVARMLHQPVVMPQKVMARTDEGIRHGGPMAFLQRMEVHRDENGDLVAEERSFRDTSISICLGTNAQRVLQIGADAVEPGGTIDVELLRPIEYIL